MQAKQKGELLHRYLLLAVYLVLQLIKRGKFEYFAYYCFVAGTAAMVYFGAR